MAKKITKEFLRKRSRVTRIQDVRQIVTQTMTRKHLKSYGLAKLTGLTEQAIRSYVKGESDMRGEKLAKVLAALGLEIRPKE